MRSPTFSKHVLGAALAAISLAAAAHAQTTINWFSIDAGGGQVSGGPFQVSGTIGQFAAGAALTGGPFTIIGGFRSVPTTPSIPTCGPSDVAGPNQTLGPDGSLSADDIIVFLSWYFASNPQADVAGQNQSIGPDGQFSADDIIVFLSRYFAGC